MANFLSKLSIPAALQSKKNKFDLTSQHITTSDFFQMNPVYIKEMIPGESITINPETFVRLAPMAVPTFGRVRIENQAFFVPMRTIMHGWNNFITDTPYYVNGSTVSITKVPYFTNDDLVNAFVTNVPSMVTPTSSTNADLVGVEVDSSTVKNFNLTNSGRHLLKVLLSLGYKVNWTYKDRTEVSALPFLAFVKIWSDWYSNPQVNTSMDVEKYFSNTSGAFHLTGSQVQDMFNHILKVSYDKDYFTSAWLHPLGPASFGSTNVISVDDVTNNATGSGKSGVTTYSGIGYTPAVRSNNFTSSAGNNLTQYLDEALHRVTDYVKRNQLAGSRAIDRYLARFGVSLNSANLYRSIHLGSEKCPIQISDIMSTADTQTDSGNTPVGAYAGKGIGYSSDGVFKYETDEFGFLVIVSTIIPKVGYYQGRNRGLQHLTKLDYFTPEFDGLGPQAIRMDELRADYGLNGRNPQDMDDYNPDAIFGYTGRYAEYKVPTDCLTGDYLLRSKNTGEDSWHLFREIDQEGSFTWSENFSSATNDGAQYDRIFNYTSGQVDHFRLIYNFNVTSYLPAKKLFDTYEFDNRCERSHDVTLDIGGRQLN